MIADEVGLGRTIIAALVASEPRSKSLFFYQSNFSEISYLTDALTITLADPTYQQGSFLQR